MGFFKFEGLGIAAASVEANIQVIISSGSRCLSIPYESSVKGCAILLLYLLNYTILISIVFAQGLMFKDPNRGGLVARILLLLWFVPMVVVELVRALWRCSRGTC